MPTMISNEGFFFFYRDQWVPQVEVRLFVCIYINNGMYFGLSVRL